MAKKKFWKEPKSGADLAQMAAQAVEIDPVMAEKRAKAKTVRSRIELYGDFLMILMDDMPTIKSFFEIRHGSIVGADGKDKIGRISGVVVNMGPGKWIETLGKRKPMDVALGDRVFWDNRFGRLDFEGVDYVWIPEAYISGKIKGPVPWWTS